MKTAALQEFRRRLAGEQPLVGLWVTLESPSIAEMGVALGVDWIVIDAEHGHLDWSDIVAHVRAAVRSNTIVLVRIAELNCGLVKRSLDLGADGVVVPWIETAEQLQQAVAFSRYPPRGVRGIGAERATAWGHCFAEHAADANDNILVVPMIETVRGGDNLSAMLEVEGVDVFFLGPADYSASAGYPGQWEGPGVADKLLQMQGAIRNAGKHCGIVTVSPQDLCRRREQGFSLLAVGTDSGLLIRSLRESLRAIDRDCQMAADFGPPTLLAAAEQVSSAPLARPPESMRPDRAEIITALGEGSRCEIAPGVSFECLVGSINQARNLTTGIVTFAGGAVLPYHTHPFGESVTLLEGAAEICVEGRQYILRELDNVAIPRGVAHQVRNLSPRQPATFHIAMASESPTRVLVEQPYAQQVMLEGDVGVPGKERITRLAAANSYAAGPNTAFVDYFNRDLMPAMDMSGGYARFDPGGRLPAHYHDFDESICIIEGTATCFVEGRRYRMRDYATAMQPRGRVHYFINESPTPMAMIWVYAGPSPERIVVDESCALPGNNLW